jgi:hypothetical protein
MKYFLDTEFFDDSVTVHPISIGIVAEDGRELYVQIDSNWRDTADSWILDHVAIHLGPNVDLRPRDAAEDIRYFVGDDPAEFWAYWAAYDWVVFCQVMGGLMKLPKNISPWVRDLAWLDPSLQHKNISPWVRDLAWLDPSLQHIRALPVENPKPHHALFDARELREQYRLLQAKLRAQ